VFVQTNSVKAVKAYFKDRLKEQFNESEIKSMIREAVMERLNLSSADYLLSDDRLLSESDLLYFRGIVKRLQTDEPFQYIMGKTVFYGLNLKTDKRALIPRPETEELVHWVTEVFTKDGTYKIMDICTGSGCIALALKSHLNHSPVIGTDLSHDALSLAKVNGSAVGLSVNWLQMDATDQKNYKQFEENSFDCWISNPPYIPQSDKHEMSSNVLDHEPHLALFVENDDALLFYREIGRAGLKYLKKGGHLFFEIHEGLGDQTVQLLKDLGYNEVTLRKDLQGKDRMVMAIR
jgi:release factor glutamine methyltransferase